MFHILRHRFHGYIKQTFGLFNWIDYLCTHDRIYTICPSTRFRCATGEIDPQPKTLALRSVGRIRALLHGGHPRTPSVGHMSALLHGGHPRTPNHAHPTAPVMTIAIMDYGRGSTASQRSTAWFILRYRCCRNSEFRLGSVGFRGVITYSSWLPSL